MRESIIIIPFYRCDRIILYGQWQSVSVLYTDIRIIADVKCWLLASLKSHFFVAAFWGLISVVSQIRIMNSFSKNSSGQAPEVNSKDELSILNSAPQWVTL